MVSVENLQLNVVMPEIDYDYAMCHRNNCPESKRIKESLGILRQEFLERYPFLRRSWEGTYERSKAENIYLNKADVGSWGHGFLGPMGIIYPEEYPQVVLSSLSSSGYSRRGDKRWTLRYVTPTFKVEPETNLVVPAALMGVAGNNVFYLDEAGLTQLPEFSNS